jgi:hypothetical protein
MEKVFRNVFKSGLHSAAAECMVRCALQDELPLPNKALGRLLLLVKSAGEPSVLQRGRGGVGEAKRVPLDCGPHSLSYIQYVGKLWRVSQCTFLFN